MRRLACTVLVVLASAAGLALAQTSAPAWPSLDQQLLDGHAIPGSALEALIRANQDFGLLDPAEAADHLPLPPWLRVLWRTAHPDTRYDASDPTGGYPRALQRALVWLTTHQDLVPEAPPAPPAPLAPDSTTVGANLRISGAQTGPRSESSIAINFAAPSGVISASNNISGSRQAQFYSKDGGVTWGQTVLPLVTGDAFHSDPAVDWSTDGTAWSLTLGFNNFGTIGKVRLYRSSDGGGTWVFDSTGSGTQSSVDKDMMWIDHSATSPFRNTVYAIWHNGNPAYVNHRTSAGWGATPIQVNKSESAGTCIGGDIKTNANGDVFAFWPATGNARMVTAKSTDGGASFGTPVIIATTFDSYDIGIPAMASRRALMYVAGGAYRTATKNLVYASWIDQTGVTGCNTPADEPGTNTSSPCKTRIWFARSTDGGATWQPPVKINDQLSKNDQFNQWLAVDDTNGRISVMYYDTVNDPGRLKTDVWYQTSTDDGVTWSAATRVTTAMTDETSAGADSGNQYGDYNGMSGHGGTFFPSWTDRRNNGFEEIWTAKITETNAPPPAPGEAPGLTVNKDTGGHLLLAWSPDCGGSATYGVYRGNLVAGYSSLAPEPGFCSVQGTSATIPLGTGRADFLLVVPNNGSTEGSFGTTSSGSRRPPAPTECFPQGTIAGCAP